LGWILANHNPWTTVEREGLQDQKKARNPLVAANKNLLQEVRRLAIKDELLAMRPRWRLVAGSLHPQITNQRSQKAGNNGNHPEGLPWKPRRRVSFTSSFQSKSTRSR